MKTIITKVPSEYYEIIESIQGQLSDGIWENSQSKIKYWKGINITPGTNGFVRFTFDNSYFYTDVYISIIKKYGEFLKEICKIYLKDYKDNENIKHYFTKTGHLKRNWFSKNNNVVIGYLQREMYFDIILPDGTVCHEHKLKDIFKVCDCLEVYKLLLLS